MPADSRPRGPRLLLELEDAEGVLARVDDPGRPGKADVGDAVLGLEPGHVVVLDLDAAGAQLSHFGPDVGDLPGRLGLGVGGPHGALGHVQVGAATALESDGVLILGQNLQRELVVVELPGRGKVLGQQHRRDRMLPQHGSSLPVVWRPPQPIPPATPVTCLWWWRWEDSNSSPRLECCLLAGPIGRSPAVALTRL